MTKTHVHIVQKLRMGGAILLLPLCLYGVDRVYYNLHAKGKVVPLQAWSGPEGSRKLRFPDFVTTAQYGDKGVSLTHRPPLPPGNTPSTRCC
jgi:hypothetical protein